MSPVLLKNTDSQTCDAYAFEAYAAYVLGSDRDDVGIYRLDDNSSAGRGRDAG
jgi:hypothetical protein